MPVVPGSRIGPYETISLIGSGGMGEVWKARDTRLDRVVAIKFGKNEFGERFKREARDCGVESPGYLHAPRCGRARRPIFRDPGQGRRGGQRECRSDMIA